MHSRPTISPLNQLKVLVVDDDEISAELVALKLEGLGVTVRCAHSANRAIAMLDDSDDMLLTDWQMPELDGMELVRLVRQRLGGENHLHIAMMTARRSADGIADALNAGVDTFLYKPVDEVQLQLAIATARRNRLLHRRLRRRAQLLTQAHARTRAALQRLREDLDAAAALHHRLLPATHEISGVRVAHLYRPTAALGGDSIGVEAIEDGRTLFFLIDVCGHGVPAALESFHLHHRLKSFRPGDAAALQSAAKTLNREVLDHGGDGYATLVVGVLDPGERRGWMVRAGHPPPLLGQGKTVRALAENGSLPLGLFDDVEFALETFEFEPGDRLIVYSDGVTEAETPSLRELGIEGLSRLVAENTSKPLATLCDDLEDRLQLRSTILKTSDDISLLALEHLGEDNSDMAVC